MRTINALTSKSEIQSQILLKIKDLSKQSQDYIQDIIILINKYIGINNVVSLILFGSQIARKNEAGKLSDCDLLIIFKDTVKDKQISLLDKYFLALEIKHKFRENSTTLFGRGLAYFQQTIGMFVSHFLTKQIYWEQIKFHKIFQVNKLISYFVAPRKIVLASVIDNSCILYGEDIREIAKNKIEIPPFEMIKSTSMNLMISIFSIFISPFKSLNAINYQLEAIKWSLKASNYYSFEDTEPLEKVISRFITLGKLSSSKKALDFYKTFLFLRKKPFNYFLFMFRAPFRIIKIHAKGLKFKGLISQKKIHK